MRQAEMYYIAAPYWHNDEKVRAERRYAAVAYSMMLTRNGVLNYSPLLYTEKFKKTDVPEKYWLEHGVRMVDACDVVRVLCLTGWKESGGIQREIKKAESQGKPIEYIERFQQLAFCGSRTCNDDRAKKLIYNEIEKHDPEIIVTHGEPEGVCTLAQEAAKKLGLTLKLHFLQLKRAGGKFHHRSKAVFEDCDYCVFIHDGESKGCSNELELAKKMKIPYTYHLLNVKETMPEKLHKQDQDNAVEFLEKCNPMELF